MEIRDRGIKVSKADTSRSAGSSASQSAVDRRRGPYTKSTLTRQSILEAATRALQAYGYRGASLRKVGELAGIDQSSIMHYFASKEALMLAVLEDAERQSAEFSREHRPEGLRDVPASMVDLARENTDHGSALVTFAVLEAEATAPDHPLHEYFRERGERRRAALAGWFRVMVDAGLLKAGVDPEIAAGSFLALWQGIEIQWLNAPEGLDVPRHLEHFLSLVLVEDWEARAREIN
jgi:AcrR family transcriptional regulator